MTTLADIKHKLTVLKPILQEKYPLETMAIFGSYARNEQTEESDVDVLVEFNGSIGLKFVTMANEIENFLKIKTDVVSRNGIKPQYYSFDIDDLIYV